MSNSRRTLLTAAIAVILSASLAFAQQVPDNDRCKAASADRQAENKQDAQAENNNSGDKLSDCGGVLKPPSVGDTELEKLAPKVGRTPVIKPGDTQHGQQDNQQPGQ